MLGKRAMAMRRTLAAVPDDRLPDRPGAPAHKRPWVLGVRGSWERVGFEKAWGLRGVGFGKAWRG
ncbi:hypothetical protein GCM10009845_22290 [Pedococcus bigeumensis]